MRTTTMRGGIGSSTLILPVMAFLLLTACPGNRKDVSPAQTSTTTQNPQLHPENSASMNPVVPIDKAMPSSRVPAAAAKSLEVQLTEYEIRIPDTLPAGTQQLHIVNAGKENHGFVIEGAGAEQKLAAPLSRGDAGDLTVTLAAGTYTVYCPVDGHRGKGMSRTLTVK